MSWPWHPSRSHQDEAAGGRRQHPIEAALSPDQVATLGDEVEAFVQGCLVDHLCVAGRPVPAWAVLNKLAHGSVADLIDLAGADRGGATGDPPTGEPAWLRAQRSLAAAMVTGATRPDDIVNSQRAVLVPLELWVIQRSRSEAITSRRVVELATEALADHRSSG